MIGGTRAHVLMRKELDNTEDNIKALHLKGVEPKKFFFFAFPCQKKAAYIKNRSITEVENCDLPMVAYRYIQCRKNNSRVSLDFYISLAGAFSSIAMSLMAYRDETIPSMFKYAFAFFPLAMANAYINYGNKSSYRETLALTEGFLEKKLPSNTFNMLQQLPSKDGSYALLLDLLKTQHINCDSLRKKLPEK